MKRKLFVASLKKDGILNLLEFDNPLTREVFLSKVKDTEIDYTIGYIDLNETDVCYQACHDFLLLELYKEINNQ